MEHLLIIEDDKGVRESLQDILTLKGYEVSTAANGNKGLVAIIKEKYSLVICDVNMPGMDGFELLKSLNECMEKEVIPPFLFLTARVTCNDIRQGMELGADDYITKPFNPQDLLTIIEAKIDKRKKILISAITKEQSRISEELHDNIQQLLVASQMGFKSINEEIATLNKDTENIFYRALDFLIEATKEVRNLSHEITKRNKIDLAKKVETLFKQLKEAGVAETHFHYSIKKELLDDKKMELLRVIQEAVNNIMKYANAKNIFILIESHHKGGKLEVKDDGIGFNSDEIAYGNGLINMQTRANKIGAEFKVESQPNQGTLVTLAW